MSLLPTVTQAKQILKAYADINFKYARVSEEDIYDLHKLTSIGESSLTFIVAYTSHGFPLAVKITLHLNNLTAGINLECHILNKELTGVIFENDFILNIKSVNPIESLITKLKNDKQTIEWCTYQREFINAIYAKDLDEVDKTQNSLLTIIANTLKDDPELSDYLTEEKFCQSLEQLLTYDLKYASETQIANNDVHCVQLQILAYNTRKHLADTAAMAYMNSHGVLVPKKVHLLIERSMSK